MACQRGRGRGRSRGHSQPRCCSYPGVAGQAVLVDSNLAHTFFEKPGFRDMLIKYLAGSYDEIRDEPTGRAV